MIRKGNSEYDRVMVNDPNIAPEDRAFVIDDMVQEWWDFISK